MLFLLLDLFIIERQKNKIKEGAVQQRSRAGAGEMQHQHMLMLLAINQADQKDSGKGKMQVAVACGPATTGCQPVRFLCGVVYPILEPGCRYS